MYVLAGVYDFSTLQGPLDQKDVRTTMINTDMLSCGRRGVCSPLNKRVHLFSECGARTDCTRKYSKTVKQLAPEIRLARIGDCSEKLHICGLKMIDGNCL